MQKEACENFLSVARENRFWMKLHAVHGELAMTQCHDFTIFALSSDLEARGKRIPLDHEPVISTGVKWNCHIVKESASVMSYHGLRTMYMTGITILICFKIGVLTTQIA